MPPHNHLCAHRLIRLALLCLLLSACAPLGDRHQEALSTPSASPAPAPPTPLPPTPALPTAGTCLARGSFPPFLGGLRYGVNAFLFGTDQGRVLTLTRQAGFGWLRHQIHWRDIEIRPGQYDWGALDLALEATRRHDLRVLLSVVRSPAWATAQGTGGLPDDPAALGSFMGALAARYAGAVSAYEIWNEPNLAIEGGGQVPTPAHYLAALRCHGDRQPGHRRRRSAVLPRTLHPRRRRVPALRRPAGAASGRRRLLLRRALARRRADPIALFLSTHRADPRVDGAGRRPAPGLDH
jgi:hypothetical protein